MILHHRDIRRGAVARWVEEWHDAPYVLCLSTVHQSLPKALLTPLVAFRNTIRLPTEHAFAGDYMTSF